MTTEELKRLRFKGVAPSPTSVGVPGLPGSCCPVPKIPSNMALVQQPARPEDFNGVPVSDVSIFRSVHDSDPLHRADILARELNKGKSLLQRFHGQKAHPENIINHYFGSKK